MTEPNGHAVVHALEPGEVVYLPEGTYLIRGFPQQVEAGEVWIEASPIDDPDAEMILKFSRADKWVQIRREVPCR
jgi:hypothetical protein